MQEGILEQNKCWLQSLGFLGLDIHGKTVQDLLDTDVTHNFMTIGIEKEVGLHIFPKDVEVKVVNLRAKVLRLASDVSI